MRYGVREFCYEYCAEAVDACQNSIPPHCTIVTKLGDFPVSLPSSIFGSMLGARAKYCLQSANREWRDIVSKPSLWRELNLRYREWDDYDFMPDPVGFLKDPRFRQLESLTLPMDNFMSQTDCLHIRLALPRLTAIDATCLSWLDADHDDLYYPPVEMFIEGFAPVPFGIGGAPLLHLRLGCGAFTACNLRWTLIRHEQLHVLEFGANRFIEELTNRNFINDYFPKHYALEALSLECTRGIERHIPFHTVACDTLARVLLVKLQNLKLLCLNEWTGISEANVSAIPQACPKLEELRLVGVAVGDGQGVATRPEGVVTRPEGMVTRPEGVSSWRVAHLPGEEPICPILIKDEPGEWHKGLSENYSDVSFTTDSDSLSSSDHGGFESDASE